MVLLLLSEAELFPAILTVVLELRQTRIKSIFVRKQRHDDWWLDLHWTLIDIVSGKDLVLGAKLMQNQNKEVCIGRLLIDEPRNQFLQFRHILIDRLPQLTRIHNLAN